MNEITKQNFDEFINSEKTVLIDFWAPYCGYCKQIAPIVDEIATEMEGKIKIGKVNIEKELDLARKFGVKSIPYLAVIKNKEVIKAAVGFMNKREILELLQ
ncbi:MAG: thioredoxin [Clostridia bacterium]|nr:thioredoxin [Clostridia bacterium]